MERLAASRAGRRCTSSSGTNSIRMPQPAYVVSSFPNCSKLSSSSSISTTNWWCSSSDGTRILVIAAPEVGECQNCHFQAIAQLGWGQRRKRVRNILVFPFVRIESHEDRSNHLETELRRN